MMSVLRVGRIVEHLFDEAKEYRLGARRILCRGTTERARAGRWLRVAQGGISEGEGENFTSRADEIVGREAPVPRRRTEALSTG